MSYMADRIDGQFRKILKISLGFYLVLGLGLSVIRLPVLEHPDVRDLPKRMAKLIMDPLESPPAPAPAKEITPEIQKQSKKEKKPKQPANTKHKQKKTVKAKQQTNTKPKPKEMVKAKPKPAPVKKAIESRPSADKNREIVRRSGLLASFIEEENKGSLSAIMEDDHLDEALSHVEIVSASTAINEPPRPVVNKRTTTRNRLADEQISDIETLKKGERISLAKREAVMLTQLEGQHGRDAASDTIGGKTHTLGKEVGVRLHGSGSNGEAINYDEIARVVEKYKGGLIFLYNKALRNKPTLKGTLTVEFSIAENGRVVEAHITTSTLHDAGLEQAVAKRIKMWKFPKLYKGIIVVTYPFVFFPV
ncbi:MAG: AgmX/PglI C-terminal domain-containing protein [Nitrospiria bacterium]